MHQEFSVPAHIFALDGNVIEIRPFGQGHINRTYRAETDTGALYLFQRVNTHVFPNFVGLMENIRQVTEHIREKVIAEGGDPHRECMTLVPTKTGENFACLEDGCWRCDLFIPNTVALQTVRDTRDFYLAARAFGKFQQQLRDFPARKLCDVIPNFHNTPRRWDALWAAVAEDAVGRVKDVQPELDFIRARKELCHVLQDALDRGELPLTVTHNDTKLNNLLFDEDTMEPVAVVDLDTVMPGTALFDFGDSIRAGAATAEEDEIDLSKVGCSMELYEAFVKGWTESCDMSQKEKELLPLAAQVLTLECGIRFLTDYLQGDTYFSVSRVRHNLDRCRTQLKMVWDMEQKEAVIRAIVKKYCG